MSVLSHFGLAYAYSYNYTSAPATSGPSILQIYAYALPFALLAIIGLWKTFTKAGRPGWAAIIPVYNLWVLYEISGKPGWWAILSFIPIVNLVGLVLIILAMIELAKRFGKGIGYALLFIFLPFIGFLMLGFGDAQYHGDSDEPFAPLT